MICHNHWTVNDAKISKSKGNFIPLTSLRQFLPGEMIRFYVLTHDLLQHDSNFTPSLVLQSVNQIADIYGNLVMRSMSKNIAGTLFDSDCIPEVCLSSSSTERLSTLQQNVSQCYDRFAFCDGFDLIVSELKFVLLIS